MTPGAEEEHSPACTTTPDIYILVTDFLLRFPLTEKRVQTIAFTLTLNLAVLSYELNPTQKVKFKQNLDTIQKHHCFFALLN